MKILHVITSLRTGGAEKLMVDLLPRLKSLGHEVDLLLFDGADTPFKASLLEAGIKIISFSEGKSVYNPKYIFRLRKLMPAYDIVHTHNYAPQIFAAIARRGKRVKLITTEHGGSNRRRNYKWFAPIDRRMFSRYDKVICIADKTKAKLVEFIGPRLTNIIVINNGVDVAKYAGAEASPELETIAPGSRKILMVAGFRWEKDQDTLIKGMASLPDRFHLFLVGGGPRSGECEQLAADCGVAQRVHFLGLRTDVAQLLHAADYVAMSSHFEGLSLSSVEGMSVGKPFLADNVNGLREVVQGAGLLFERGDAAGFAALIKELDADPELYTRIAEQCGARAAQFDICKMVAGYDRLYRQLSDN